MTLKVGVTGIGSALRGMYAEEMKHSNSAVLDSVMFRILADVYDAEFYLLKPTLVKTRELLEQRQDEGDEYAKRWHLTFLKDIKDYPEELDMLFIQQGASNLQLGGGYHGISFTHAWSCYHNMAMYPDAKRLYMQTDFATPWLPPVAYDRIFTGMFPGLSNKETNVIPMGVEPSDPIAGNCNFMSNCLRSTVKHHTSVDFQFIVDLPEPIGPVAESCSHVSFAGKNRVRGSRIGPLFQLSDGNELPLKIIGNWKGDYVEGHLESNPSVTTTGKYLEYAEVLKDYNEAGITLYISCPEYRNVATITSRLADALKANCLPLIWHEEAETFYKYFNKDLIDQLIVSDAKSAKNAFDYFKDRPEERQMLIEEIRAQFKIHNATVRADVMEIIEDILMEEAKECTSEALRSDYYQFLTELKPTGRLNDERSNSIINTLFELEGKSLEEIIKADPYKSKIALGWYYSARDRESWDDVPVNYIELLDKLMSRVK